MKKFKSFPSKILLFGEHIINKGANGLATAFYSYKCRLSFSKTDKSLKESKPVLDLIYDQISNNSTLSNLFDLERFQTDINNALFINMDIPIGYGLGSSGAICASIYHEYALIKNNNPLTLKTILGEMEGAFHGKSSGLDPLVSYLGKSVLVTKDKTEINEFYLSEISEFQTFLIDTKQPRKTAPLVNLFLETYKNNKDFAFQVDNNIIPLTNDIINDFLSNNLKETYSKIAQLSKLHLENFKFLILDKHLSIWENALNNKDFFLKICGAGGGGFMLGFCKDKAKVLEVFTEDELIFL